MLLLQSANTAFAQEKPPFIGKINSDNINIRADSTVSSEAICNVDKGQNLEVVSESYEWYKVKLPKNAPSFIKKSLVSVIENKADNTLEANSAAQIRTAVVARDKVNIRLHPSESSPILGQANKNEVINILQDREAWFKIEPIDNSFGWINKKFVTKGTGTKQEITDKDKITAPPELPQENVTIEGIISPYGMVVKRPATHKLITSDKKIFLLTGNKKSLDALNYHKVRITGKIISPSREKYPVIEIKILETAD
ncbi:MAG: SH3 domain-containing protein [Candidatus Omnitrophica bacterium]|nr:SH3 domain-containing protein [Candidatus Omnitrophota bacterium]